MTARHSLSVLHFSTAGYVSSLPLTVGIDGAVQQKGQLFPSLRKIRQIHTLSHDKEAIVAYNLFEGL